MRLAHLHRDQDSDENVFLAVNNGRRSPENCFKNGNLGNNSFPQYVRSACDSVNVKGVGVCDHMTLYGLHGTVITRLVEAGHADASDALRSGHRDHHSFASYRNLRGRLGETQQIDILGASQATTSRNLQRAGESSTPTVIASPNNGEDVLCNRASDRPSQSFLSNLTGVDGGLTVNVNYNTSPSPK